MAISKDGVVKVQKGTATASSERRFNGESQGR